MCVYRVDQDHYYPSSAEKLYIILYGSKLVKSHIIYNFYDYFMCKAFKDGRHGVEVVKERVWGCVGGVVNSVSVFT